MVKLVLNQCIKGFAVFGLKDFPKADYKFVCYWQHLLNLCHKRFFLIAKFTLIIKRQILFYALFSLIETVDSFLPVKIAVAYFM